MKKTLDSDLVRGNIDTIILVALSEGDRFGTDIIKEIEHKSSGQYVIKEPTLYSALSRLEMQGLVRSYKGQKTIGGRRKYYAITDSGKAVLENKKGEWIYSKLVIDKLITDNDPDYRPLNTAFLDTGVSAEDGLSSPSTEAETLLSEEEITEEEVTEEEIKEEENILSGALLDETKELQSSDTESSQQEDLISGESYSDSLLSEDYTPPQEEFNFESLIEESKIEEAQPSTTVQNIYKTTNINYTASSTSTNTTTTSATTSKEPERVAQKEEKASGGIILPPVMVAKPEVKENKYGVFDYDSKGKLERGEENYRAILYRLIENQAMAVPEAKGEKTKEHNRIVIPPSKEENEFSYAVAPVSNSLVPVQQYSSATVVSREISDAIVVRDHSGVAAKDHSTGLYYFSNRLMFVQYLICFGIMLFFTGLTFLVARVWLNTPGPVMWRWFDNLMYIIAISVTVILPLVALIKVSRNPNKQKRIRYNFKNALKFRFVLMANCIVLTYLVNVYLGMGASFQHGIDHLASLLLPMLFSLCLPLSSIIFYRLFIKGKYAVN